MDEQSRESKDYEGKQVLALMSVKWKVREWWMVKVKLSEREKVILLQAAKRNGMAVQNGWADLDAVWGLTLVVQGTMY